MGRVSLITNRRGLQPLYYGTHQLIYLVVLINTCFHFLLLTSSHLLFVSIIIMTGLISFMGFYTPLASCSTTKLLKHKFSE